MVFRKLDKQKLGLILKKIRSTFVISLTVILFSQAQSASAQVTEQANTPKPTQAANPLADLVLTMEQFMELRYGLKIAYVELLIEVTAVAEEFQGKSEAKKSAQIHLEKIIRLIFPEAIASRPDLLGQPCLIALNEGTWSRNSDGSIFCLRPREIRDSTCRQAGQVRCGVALTDLAGVGSICVPPNQGQESVTARCASAILRLANRRAQSGGVERLATAEQRATFTEFLEGLRKASLLAQSQVANCARNNPDAPDECTQLTRLRGRFETIIRENGGVTGVTLAPRSREPSPPAQASRTPREATREATRETSPQPNFFDFLFGGLRGLPNPLAQNETPVASQPPSEPRTSPRPQRAPAPPQPENEIRETPAVRPQAQRGNCANRYQAQLGPLACVACGMESVSPADIQRGGGVSKWLTVLGAMAQTNYGPYNTQDATSRQSLQKRVMEMVTSYGYCTDREYPAEMSGLGDKPRQWIEGRSSLRSGQDQRVFAERMGFMGGLSIGGWNVRENDGQPMVFANQIFNDRHFDHGNVHQTRNRFQSMIHAHRRSYPNQAFSKCAEAANNRLRSTRLFRMCQIRQGRDAEGFPVNDYPETISDRELANNEALYSAMARSCGIPAGRRQPSRDCDHGCWGNYYTYSYATSNLPGCGNDRALESRQRLVSRERGEPSRNRTPPGRLRGEPSRNRGSYTPDYGGNPTGDSTESNNGGGGDSAGGGSQGSGNTPGGGSTGGGGKGSRGESSGVR